MQNRMKLFFSAVLLIIMILSMVTPAFAAETEPATEHTHTWQTLSATTGMHYVVCTTCDQTQSGPHTFNSEEICVVCGRYVHTHKWQRTEADSQFHTVVCTDCGESQTVTHSMNGDVCTVCGYETHTHTMQYVGGAVYQLQHETKCTSCDAIGMEKHTYGSDDKCTVCGAERPCDHQWICNGEQYNNDQHILKCACGQTKHEPHSWMWNAEDNCAVCTVCGTKDGHWHKYVYPNGTQCIECGYYRGTAGSANQPNRTEPAETKPAETKPAETKPAETKPAETKPAETKPAETKPAETEPAETEPTETKPEVSETIDEEDRKVDSQSDGSILVWVVVVVSIAVGLTAGLFLWKKKSS